jgi:hypothetical protein
MKPSQKVNKMVLVDFNEYNNLMNRFPPSNISFDPVRENLYEDERLSDRDKVELDSYILRNRNRVRFEAMQKQDDEKKKQDDEISKLIQHLKRITVKPGEQKHASTSTGTTETTDSSTSMSSSMYFPEMVDKGVWARPKMVNTGTQMTKNYGGNPESEYLEWKWYQKQNENHSTPEKTLNKSQSKTPKSSERPKKAKTPKSSEKSSKTPSKTKPTKPHQRVERVETRSVSRKNQSGSGWRGWYRMPFN